MHDNSLTRPNNTMYDTKSFSLGYELSNAPSFAPWYFLGAENCAYHFSSAIASSALFFCKKQNRPPLPSFAAAASNSTMMDPPHDTERAQKQLQWAVVGDSGSRKGECSDFFLLDFHLRFWMKITDSLNINTSSDTDKVSRLWALSRRRGLKYRLRCRHIMQRFGWCRQSKQWFW